MASLLNSTKSILEYLGTSTNGLMGMLASAAYALNVYEAIGEDLNEAPTSISAQNFAYIEDQLHLFTSADLTSLTSPAIAGNSLFLTGISNGIYTNGNAAALVGRSEDALFIAFRGTNDGGRLPGSSPDSSHWLNPSDHYDLLRPLVAAIDDYLIQHPEIKHVYVTGHSLGGGMVQKFMSDHEGSQFSALTLGSSGYNERSSQVSLADDRMINIVNEGDTLNWFLHHPRRGDTYTLIDVNSTFGYFNKALHEIDLYSMEVGYVEDVFKIHPLNANNGKIDHGAIHLDISNDGQWEINAPNFTPFVATHAPFQNVSDYLIGIPGSTLTGGLGADFFILGGTGKIVTIRDFERGKDLLLISGDGAFPVPPNQNPIIDPNSDVILVNSHSANMAFHRGNDPYFIFDDQGANKGTLYWDATGGSGRDAIPFAKLLGVSKLAAADFDVFIV